MPRSILCSRYNRSIASSIVASAGMSWMSLSICSLVATVRYLPSCCRRRSRWPSLLQYRSLTAAMAAGRARTRLDRPAARAYNPRDWRAQQQRGREARLAADTFALHFLNGVTFGALLFLLASGYTLIFGLMRITNLSHGGFYLIGGYVGLSILWLTGS